MSRPTRVPYHQNVYDLLDIDFKPSGRAEAMIARHEAKHRPLPAAVREWYTVPKVVRLTPGPGWDEFLWCRYSNMDPPLPLSVVLTNFAYPGADGRRRFAEFMGECQNVASWHVELTRSADPPVWMRDDAGNNDPGDEWKRVAKTFSEFVWNWIAEFHEMNRKWAEPSFAVPHANGFWAARPAGPYPVPVEDYLIEQFGDPKTVARDGYRRLTFPAGDGVIRMTADEAGARTPHAAWWVFAPSEKTFRTLMRDLGRWGLPVKKFRTSDETYESRRCGA